MRQSLAVVVLVSATDKPAQHYKTVMLTYFILEWDMMLCAKLQYLLELK